MRKLLLILTACGPLVLAATKPAAPAWQSGNSLASGCIRYWYVQSSTTTIADLSPTGLNLTFTGTPTLVTAPGGTGNEYGVSAAGVYATGSDSGLPSGTSAWTIAVWVKTSQSLASNGEAIMGYWGQGGGSANQRVLIEQGNFSGHTAQSADFGPIGSVLTGNAAINDNNWHRIVVTYAGGASGAVTLYVDGSSQGTANYTMAVSLSGSVMFNNSAAATNGSLGDMAIWNRALSAADVASDFADPWQEVRAAGALTIGAISKSGASGLTAINLTVGAAGGGASPYTYQWQRSPYHAGAWTNVGGNSTSLADSGLAPGTSYDYRCTVTDNNSATATAATLSAITLFPTDDSHIAYTPASWYTSGAAPAAWTATNRGGAEMRFGFTGTYAALVLDMTNVTTPANLGTVYQVDDLPRPSIAVPSATMTLASGLASGTHTAHFWDAGQSSAANTWNVNGASPDYVIKVVGVQLDAGASMAAPPSVPVDKLILFGDSITAGTAAGPGGAGDYLYAYPTALAAALGSEPAMNGFPSSGWTVTAGGSNVPPFLSAFGNYWNGRPRTLANLFKRATINLGQNDGSGYSATVSADLAALRTALGAATTMYVLVPFSGQGRSAITAGFAGYCGAVVTGTLSGTGTYQRCAADSSAYLIDLGANAQTGFGGGASFESVDGTHPNTFTQARMAALIAQAIQTIEAVPVAGSSTAQ